MIFYSMDDNNTYYDCKCTYYDVGVILCRTCSEWFDNVEKTVQDHRKIRGQ